MPSISTMFYDWEVQILHLLGSSRTKNNSNLCQWLVPCSMIGRFSFRICWAAAEQKIIQAEQRTFNFFVCWTEEHGEPCCMVLCKTKQGRETCARSLETCAGQSSIGGGVFSISLFPSPICNEAKSVWSLCCKKSHH
jgi:hypothetical protein